MEITHKISMDFGRRGPRPRIEAVQGDSYTRVVELRMYENGAAWPMPDGASAMVRYRKSDDTGGVYEELPDGSAAWSAEGNVMRVILAPQMLTAPGCVDAQVEIVLEQESLATFTFYVIVEQDPSLGALESTDYVNWRSWITARLREAMESGAFDGASGVTPELQIGQVTTLSAGAQATACITGTPEKPLLNLGIPGSIAVESREHSGCYYRLVDDEVEWLNPPMILGTQYRTAERYLGRPVYQVCFRVEGLSGLLGVRKALSDVIGQGAERIVECGGQLSDGKMIPYVGVDEPIYLAAEPGSVWVCKTGDVFGDVTATVWIKYIRSEASILVDTSEDAILITTSLTVMTQGDTIIIGGE